ncbi:hypothetical protein P5P86_03185 [Nocardioides sp. BP30]|uniref:hypothetical protein n=1 Tax=Nocardioides sp. BP30 TaxID=3036374 RepID=UPI0024698A5B|nr:hypothetical protein [Nocardioides sp. BP30]WGL52833.1 hypothetical protein P5P86_03185 [Nocardioides sp. BP30]
MHYYDCPCEDCRRPTSDALYQRVLTVIERLEQELERPRVKEYETALQWLQAVCGGPAAVRALDTVPLRGPVPLPEDRRVGEVSGLLRTVAAELFDTETEVAFLRALDRLWSLDPGLVAGPVAPAYVAAGVAWAVGEANGSVGTDRRVTSSRLKFALETPGAPSTYARPIRTALQGLWRWQVEHTWPAPALPALSPLGHLDLLTSRTRVQLVRVREHALAARAEDRAAA